MHYRYVELNGPLKPKRHNSLIGYKERKTYLVEVDEGYRVVKVLNLWDKMRTALRRQISWCPYYYQVDTDELLDKAFEGELNMNNHKKRARSIDY